MLIPTAKYLPVSELVCQIPAVTTKIGKPGQSISVALKRFKIRDPVEAIDLQAGTRTGVR